MRMSERDTGAERRRAQRVDATLALNLHIDIPGMEGAAAPETINVSSTGVYFRSTRYIEPMTKLSLNFDVPTDGEGTAGPVVCEGIVARVVPEVPAPDTAEYEIAVFFTVIDADSLANLESYIALRLAP
jgi:hypothetical protein